MSGEFESQEAVGMAVMEPKNDPTAASSEDQIAALAYSYWEARGYQGGSSEEDWFRAEKELRERQSERGQGEAPRTLGEAA
jgi:hypothetical protein